MTIAQLAIAEYKALKAGNLALAEQLQRQRWEQAMSLVACSENAPRKETK